MIKTRAVIFLNGDLPASASPQAMQAGLAISDNDFLIGVDGGTKMIQKLKLKPDIIIGDLDSLPRPPKGVPVIQYPTDKNETDSELALNYALKEGFKEILVVGFLGRRLDHLLSNVMVLTRLHSKAKISVIEGKQKLFFIRAPSGIILEGKLGQLVSLIPLMGDCIVTTTGLKWRLQVRNLQVGTGKGVSNEMIGKKATIKVTKGVLLVVHTLS